MGDSFTNLLLVTLISLLGVIAKIFYNKLEEYSQDIKRILIKDMESEKDIERLDEIVTDHEQRISKLEG